MDDAVREARKLCREWGEWKMSGREGFSSTNIIAKVMKWGVSESGTNRGDFELIRDCPRKFQHVENTWKFRMDDRERAAFFMAFATKYGYERAAEQLGVSVATYYRIKDSAVEKVTQ